MERPVNLEFSPEQAKAIFDFRKKGKGLAISTWEELELREARDRQISWVGCPTR